MTCFNRSTLSGVGINSRLAAAALASDMLYTLAAALLAANKQVKRANQGLIALLTPLDAPQLLLFVGAPVTTAVCCRQKLLGRIDRLRLLRLRVLRDRYLCRRGNP